MRNLAYRRCSRSRRDRLRAGFDRTRQLERAAPEKSTTAAKSTGSRTQHAHGEGFSSSRRNTARISKQTLPARSEAEPQLEERRGQRNLGDDCPSNWAGSATGVAPANTRRNSPRLDERNTANAAVAAGAEAAAQPPPQPQLQVHKTTTKAAHRATNEQANCNPLTSVIAGNPSRPLRPSLSSLLLSRAERHPRFLI